MRRSSGILYLPYIFRTLKRVYKPTDVISTKLHKMSSFCQNMACGYRERAGVDLSDIYVWRMDKYLSLSGVCVFLMFLYYWKLIDYRNTPTRTHHVLNVWFLYDLTLIYYIIWDIYTNYQSIVVFDCTDFNTHWVVTVAPFAYTVAHFFITFYIVNSVMNGLSQLNN